MALLYIKVLLIEHPLHLLRNQTYTPSLIRMDGCLLGSSSHLFEHTLLIFMSPVCVSHKKKCALKDGRESMLPLVENAACGRDIAQWQALIGEKTFITEGLSTKLHTWVYNFAQDTREWWKLKRY